MSASIPVYEAKAKLSKLIERALSGEDVVISRGGTPVVRLCPVKQSSGREFGSMKGRAKVTKEFFEPLSEDELSSWE